MSGENAVELVLLIMVAGFLVLRLRGVLGRRVGFERTEAPAGPARVDGRGPVIDGHAEGPRTLREVPPAESLAGQGLSAIRRADPAFDPQRFLGNAEAAFRLIVSAFARGDRPALQRLLGTETYAGFEAAITAREAAGETQQSDIKAIPSQSILSATMAGTAARIVVRFVSDQVNTTLDRAGAPVHGTDAVTELTDIWTFERDTRSSDPAWHLVDARTG